MNKDNNNVLQKDNINALLIISKCMQLEEIMISEINKIMFLENSLKDMCKKNKFRFLSDIFLYFCVWIQN